MIPEFKPELKEFKENPFPIYSKFRNISPLLYREEFNDWIVTGFDEVKTLLMSPRGNKNSDLNFMASEYEKFDYSLKSSNLLTLQKKASNFFFNHSIGCTDPPYFNKIKEILNKYFSRKSVKNYYFEIEHLTNKLIDNIKNSETIDLVDDFAFPITVTFIASILGLPPEDKLLFRKWSYIYLAAMDLPNSKKKTSKLNMTFISMANYLQKIYEKKKHNLQDDLFSHLINENNLGNIKYEAVIGNIMSILLGGFENTQNSICFSIYNLFKYNQFKLLKNNPKLFKNAIEELIRFNGTVQCRYSNKYNLNIGDKQIKEEQTVYLIISAANHDPNAFINPDVLDIKSEKRPHLGFGIGLRFCIGTYLARIKLEIALKTIFKKLPNIELMENSLTWNDFYISRSVKHLWVSNN